MSSGEYPFVLLSNGLRLLLQSKEIADSVVIRLKESTEDVTIEVEAKIEPDHPSRRYVLLRTHVVAVVFPPQYSGAGSAAR